MTQSLTKLYALLNSDQNPKPAFTPTNIVLENVQPASGANYNSQVTLRAVEGQGYEGTSLAKYRRLSLAFLFADHLAQVMPETPQALLDQLNAASGAWVDLEDLEAFTLPVASGSTPAALTLTAKANSFGFRGQATFQLTNAYVPPVVDVEDGTIEPDVSAFLFRDTYNTGDGVLTGRVPEAGTYVFDYYNDSNNLPPVVDAGELKAAPGMSGLGLDGTFAPVTSADGVLSLRTVIKNYGSSAVLPELSYLDFGLASDDGSYVGASLGVGNGSIAFSNSGAAVNSMIDGWVMPADIAQPLEVEVRWDLATGDAGVYVAGVLLHTLTGTGAVPGSANAFWLYAGDARDVLMDVLEIKTGVATLMPTPAVGAPLLNVYAHGASDANGFWNKLERRTTMGNDGTPISNKIAGKVDAAPGALVQWVSEWVPAASNTTGAAPGFLPNRGPSTFPEGDIVVDPVYDYALAALVDPAPLLGTSVGVMRVWAYVDGVPTANYFSVGFAYQEPNGLAFSDTPYVDGQLTSAWVEIGFAPAPALVLPEVLIRDDFDGAAGTDFVGRVPNVSASGYAYSDLSGGSNAKFVVDGAGSAYTTVGTQEAAYGFLAYDEGSNLRVEFTLRNADGVSALASNFDAIWSVEVHSAGQPARQADFGIESAGELYMYSAQAGDGTVPYEQVLGAGGAAVKFTLEWGNGHQKFYIDDVLQSDLVITEAGEPLGAGTLYLQLEPGNKIDYLQLSQLP